ncbi:MAG: helix-turn-helix domain-containing protein [Coriobacteriia bacterium]
MAELQAGWKPDVPLPPGETIREILEDRAISQADFATRLGKSEKYVSQLVNGKASLSYETAIELERVLGVPASFWNTAEATYRGLLARMRKDAGADELSDWTRSFPLKDMAERGWIARESTAAEQAEELLAFFGVSSVEAYRDYWGADKRLAARMSAAYSPETSAIAAWLRAGERAAEGVRTEPFNEARFRAALTELRAATRLAPSEWIPLVTERCAAAGVAVVFVHDLPTLRCHAVSWWANRSRAIIQLGLRGKTDDQVWFSFFHEAGHLLLDERGSSSINDLAAYGPAEARANAFAGDFLIPAAEYKAFLAAGGRMTKQRVLAFAEQIGVAPGIVVGRLQRDGLVPYNQMQALKTRLEWAE